MKKVEKQMSMEINGGHYVTAWPHADFEASQSGVTQWERHCPNQNHTTIHRFSSKVYYYRWGTGRQYACPITSCNK